jgi:Cu+-exporting ATPase
VVEDNRAFCCTGCATVYSILADHQLDGFYRIDRSAGRSQRGRDRTDYRFLDDDVVSEELHDYQDGERAQLRLYLPDIHCASCVWLLEKLPNLDEGVSTSRVHFPKRELFLSYDPQRTQLSTVSALLAQLGYPPEINLADLDRPRDTGVSRRFTYQLGVAGFAFGNIMLLSFPEYLGLEASRFHLALGILNILLALPVVFYSGVDYLRSAWTGLRFGRINIDIPIALGILTLFGRSLFEIGTGYGAGYLDSLAGLVFFLLVGKWFQRRAYDRMSFERDYKSYFPVAAQRLRPDGTTESVVVKQLQPGDRLRIKYGELLPADALLRSPAAEIDYSFVTGEADPVGVQQDQRLFAGGRLRSAAIEVELTKAVSQSYLTQLWNQDAFQKEGEQRISELTDEVGKYFTALILLIGLGTLLYWLPRDPATAVNAFTAVLIIACPCALALSVPFTLGNVARILARLGFYVKHTQVLEDWGKVTTTVLDKTGTITRAQGEEPRYEGTPLSDRQQAAVRALVSQSNHPVSRALATYFATSDTPAPVAAYREVPGCGVQGTVGGNEVQIGAADWIGLPDAPTGTWIAIDGAVLGVFHSRYTYRQGWQELLAAWQERGTVHLVSGDTEKDRDFLARYLPAGQLHFRQHPQDKLDFVARLQDQGENVLMLGDGLNDAGALRQADLGFVIAESSNNFTPACDAILAADAFERLEEFRRYARTGVRIVIAAFVLAAIYNVVGLSFAVQGLLSPVIAAILMPLSSVSVVAFGLGLSTLFAPRNTERSA